MSGSVNHKPIRRDQLRIVTQNSDLFYNLKFQFNNSHAIEIIYLTYKIIDPF